MHINDTVDLGGFSIAQWKIKREILKSNLDYSKDWDEVIEWYNQRLNLRYFAPMKRTQDQIDGAGFTLTTIQCVLIEHLASITQGKIHNQECNKNSPNYEYSSSSKHFQDFLKSSYLFQDYFTSQLSLKPEFDTTDFYTNVRCGLLHEACTKNNWRINTLTCGYPNPNRRIIVKEKTGIKRIFRDILNEKLTDFIKQYKKDLEAN